jgi:hypothetical protein
MHKLPFLLVATLAFSACRSPVKRFPNFEKWILHDVVDRRPLNGHPKEVVEYSVFETRPADSADARRYRFLYRFSADGDIVFKANYHSDSVIGTTTYQYDENGIQSKFSLGRDTITLRSRAFGEYSFRTVYIQSNHKPIAALESFPPGGRERIEIKYKDTAVPGIVDVLKHTYLDSAGRTLRVVDSPTDGAITERRFFYSRSFIADSIQVWTDDGSEHYLITRAIFFINEHGDPERYLVVGRTDTISDTRYTYFYDRYGNWTMRSRRDVKADTHRAGEVGDAPGMAMKREYVY